MYVEYQGSTFMDDSYDDTTCTDIKQRRSMEMLNLRAYVSKIRELVILSLSLTTHTHIYIHSFLASWYGVYYLTCFSILCHLIFFFFNVLTTCSIKNLWQLICYGGEVLREFWKVKGTSKRQMTRYIQSENNVCCKF